MMRSEDQPNENLNQHSHQQGVVPYGGDAAVARSMVAVHVRNPWTGRCRACSEVYPCPDRQDAEAVLGPPPRPQRMVALFVVLALIAALTAAIVAALVVPW